MFIRCLAVVLLLCGSVVRAQPGSTVLFVATERLTDLALGHAHFPQFARLGFGPPAAPWHTWFGGAEMGVLVHLPGYKPGDTVKLRPEIMIGNRFQGRSWNSAFAALASFDRDGNGIVEAQELSELYLWVDLDGNGTMANRDDAMRPASQHFAGFDIRAGAKPRVGHARTGNVQMFSVLVHRASRIHLLELDVSESHPSRKLAYLSLAGFKAPAAKEADSPFNGNWLWTLTDAEQWKDATRPWGKDAGGQLMLAVDGKGIRGLVQFVGPHGDRINLPLQGSWSAGIAGQAPTAQWTSVSPLGLTRSEVRLESRFGYPVLRARSWSNRNGKVREWTWEARHDKPLD